MWYGLYIQVNLKTGSSKTRIQIANSRATFLRHKLINSSRRNILNYNPKRTQYTDIRLWEKPTRHRYLLTFDPGFDLWSRLEEIDKGLMIKSRIFLQITNTARLDKTKIVSIAIMVDLGVPGARRKEHMLP